MDDKTLSLVLIVLSGVMGLLLLLRLALIYRALRLYWSRSYSAASNVSQLDIAPPLEAEPLIAALRALGFQRLGEVQICSVGAQEPIMSWLFGQAQGEVLAELSGPLPSLGLTTMFQDGAVVQTMHPRGETVNAPDYVCCAVPESVAAAHQRHRRQVREFGARHGRPRLVRDVHGYLDLDAVYRAHHGQRLSRAFLKRQFVALLFNLYGLAIPLGGMLAQRHTDLSPGELTVGLSVLLYTFFLARFSA
jgi:hypothetical protein